MIKEVWNGIKIHQYFNKIESPEINTYMCVQLIFRKGMKKIPILAQFSTTVLESSAIPMQIVQTLIHIFIMLKN